MNTNTFAALSGMESKTGTLALSHPGAAFHSLPVPAGLTRHGLVSRWLGRSLPPVLLALALAVPTGCASVRSPGGVARLAGSAAEIGTRARLLSHPQDRALFERAHTELTAALAARNFEAEAFAAIMRQLPVLRDGRHALYAGLAVMLWNDLMADATLVDRPGAVRTVMESVRDGLGRGLGLPPPVGLKLAVPREGGKDAKAELD